MSFFHFNTTSTNAHKNNQSIIKIAYNQLTRSIKLKGISEKAEIISKHFKNSRLAGNDDKFRVVDVKAGSEFAMKCLADGNSDPNVVWLHNEVRWDC